MALGFFLAEAYHNKPDKVLSGFINRFFSPSLITSNLMQWRWKVPPSYLPYRGRSLARYNQGLEESFFSVSLLKLFSTFQASQVMYSSAFLVVKQDPLWNISAIVDCREFPSCSLYQPFLANFLESRSKWASPVLSAYLMPLLLLSVIRIDCWSSLEEKTWSRPSLFTLPLLRPCSGSCGTCSCCGQSHSCPHDWSRISEKPRQQGVIQTSFWISRAESCSPQQEKDRSPLSGCSRY